MINLEVISKNIVKIKLVGKLQVGDFPLIAPQIDGLIQQYGRIRIIGDGTEFKGWENENAFKEHVHFVMLRHRKIERVAIIPGKLWQSIILNIAKRVVRIEIRTFKRKQTEEAKSWALS